MAIALPSVLEQALVLDDQVSQQLNVGDIRSRFATLPVVTPAELSKALYLAIKGSCVSRGLDVGIIDVVVDVLVDLLLLPLACVIAHLHSKLRS